jgi:superfamily II DNA or RNA helicase
MINRFSSRSRPLDQAFLRQRLRGARSYHRIAGYFRSSLLELVHEELDTVGQVRIVCNSDLDPKDLRVEQLRDLALREKWNEAPPEAEAIFGRDRYRRLYALLQRGSLEVRVVGRNSLFLHGKAGVIEAIDGARTAFMGSVNETREGWSEHYELLWEDDSPEAAEWVEGEFQYLWEQAIPLPKVILEEIERSSRRVEYRSITECPESELPQAALAEAPIFRRGEGLMPWQRAFVSMFLDHRETYGMVRLLLADEVGLGKTLSLATSAVIGCLLHDGPVLVLCPATLTLQWQTELWDKLGVPSAVWTNQKTWLDHTGHHIKTRGAADVSLCPYQIGIVSTGLIFRSHSTERQRLLGQTFGTLVLDEAHRARRGAGTGPNADEPNNLLDFMFEAAKNSRHVILGTATPIQTEVRELWDLLEILGNGAEHVLGQRYSRWRVPDGVLPLVTGEKGISDPNEGWDLIRNPLPPGREEPLFGQVRQDIELSEHEFFTDRALVDLRRETQELVGDRLIGKRQGLGFFQRQNPMVRHTVLRKRATLEERDLLPRIGVDLHPSEEDASKSFFDGIGLLTSPSIDAAYQAALAFTDLLRKRMPAAGFLKSLLLQRICSSLEAGRTTAERLLAKNGQVEDEDIAGADDQNTEDTTIEPLGRDESAALKEVIRHLSSRPSDPKFEAVWHFLTEAKPVPWLELGCIVFSQYYDTAYWAAESLAGKLPDERIAVYAGADRSGIYHEGHWTNIDRNVIKKAVKDRQIRLVLATDAACEGLNLQTLGTLINIDLPWNPSRLEQRLGRIKRIGQVRESVDMLNLVYRGTRDEDIYQRLSSRMKDRFDVFGALPDVIKDEWIDDIELLDEKMSEFIEQKRRMNAFDIRYNETIDPKGEKWERCANVLSRRDLVEWLSKGW